MAKKRKESLIIGHLEKISSKVFSDFPKQITDLAGKQHGVYALYKGNKLYYVGLATNLRRRVTTHLRDRHAGKWDKFSLFLIRDSEHIRELESLLIRIADPKGNAKLGGFAESENLKGELKRQIKLHQEEQLKGLIGKQRRRGRRGAVKPVATVSSSDNNSTLTLPPKLKLFASYKGESFTAIVLKGGRIRCGDTIFKSPSGAARSITGRKSNGWKFWKYSDETGRLQRLNTLKSDSVKRSQKRGLRANVSSLQPGLKLERVYKGKRYTATVMKDGRIKCRGGVYNSLTAAANSIVTGTVSGWYFWKYENPEGKMVQVFELKRNSL